ncbi:putative nucleotidyltransferase with HDIG domain [Sphingomonas vulcanisoli]|uniref:Nucleotidyltransferase with HDIG domain n=1 Tax=Sphingomonas vulcanisoli TaxID=1658060 RepID=A0ABX0TWE6_9SPHN|nr:HD-GYP domain-containing protein [Sphingomonas vulcanisoli]NIJ07931.1 putative nucleotidyltransferase with HDIG domain [Sphingomonas vulcanisoli]
MSIHASRATGPAPASLPLAELLGAFSYALDITEGQPEGHCVRACWIGSHIGRAIGLSEAALAELYYVLLLKDLGCSSNAARICDIYLADDRAFKRDFKLVGSGLRPVLGFLLKNVGRNVPLRQRGKAILNILKNGPAIAQEMIETRCTRGADIARQLHFSDAVASGIYSLDELWDGSGKPDHLAGEAIPLFSRIALLAQVVEVFHAAAGPEAAMTEARGRSGSWFDPTLVAALENVAAAPDFWTGLASPTIATQVLALEPAQHVQTIDEDYLDDIAAAFGFVVDAKSPYTGGHSQRVADYSIAVAERVGFPADRLRWLKRGALLHDIGKLGVSNAILDKPGSLDEGEWVVMRGHADATQAILGRISAFHDLAPIAAAHHERLDGKGYPLGLQGQEIDLATRIITISDFYDALTADRPYRGAMPAERALAIIGEEVGRAIDPRCFAALKDYAGLA